MTMPTLFSKSPIDLLLLLPRLLIIITVLLPYTVMTYLMLLIFVILEAIVMTFCFPFRLL